MKRNRIILWDLHKDERVHFDNFVIYEPLVLLYLARYCYLKIYTTSINHIKYASVMIWYPCNVKSIVCSAFNVKNIFIIFSLIYSFRVIEISYVVTIVWRTFHSGNNYSFTLCENILLTHLFPLFSCYITTNLSKQKTYKGINMQWILKIIC